MSMSAVVKIIVVTDDETAERLEAIAELSPKERERSEEAFSFTDADGSVRKLHYVLSETV